MIPIRSRSRFRFRLALLAVVPACGLIKINGKPLGGSPSATADATEPSEPGGGDEPAAPELGKAAARPAAPPIVDTQTLAVAGDFRPNPMVLDNLAGKADDDLFTKYHIKNGCEGYVIDHPAAVLELAHPLSSVTISAPGAGVIYVRFGSKFICDSPDAVGVTPKVSMPTWPAGKVEIYAGHYNSHTRINYSIEIEDTSRKRDVDWKPRGGVIKLAALPAKTVVASVAVPAAGETPRGVMDCPMFTSHFRKDPDLMMTLSRPLAGLEITTRSATPVFLQLIGPIPDDGRDMPGLCFEAGEATLGRLEPGRYAIKLGTRGEAAAASVVIRGPDTPRDPLQLADSISDTLAIGDRSAMVQFPQLVEDDVWNGDPLRQQLVAAAPRQLFVFPRYDLDDTTAKLELRVGTSMEGAWPDDSTWDWPKKDEPLLPFARGFYLATDGSIYQLTDKDLAQAPSGPIKIPVRARNPGLGWGYSVNAAGKDDKARLDAYWRTANKYQACGDAVWGPYNNKIAALKREAYSDARQERIASLEHTARLKEVNGCGMSKVDAQRAKVWKELMASRTARRTAALAGIRKRLLGMFPR